MIKKTYLIQDMHCANCAMILEGIEDRLSGIHSISASYRRATLEVEFDPAKITEAQILAEINRLGYHPSNGGSSA